jgi:hypothetical protein
MLALMWSTYEWWSVEASHRVPHWTHTELLILRVVYTMYDVPWFQDWSKISVLLLYFISHKVC